jgi:hypothetical protein
MLLASKQQSSEWLYIEIYIESELFNTLVATGKL